MSTLELQQESLSRAKNGESWSNYSAIFRGFIAKGIEESEIKPRENVFTYNAWKALGRQVTKGQHGVRITTFREIKDKATGTSRRAPWFTTVFHITQTEAI